ncbi:FG-GAP repeat-containing protein, cohesin domain-containing [Desulfonema magnum]|uniref:FG-GAP repeat-containing protein, cohesin domain-containing n=1 Tax=Desulfonema magnum TaxID=45655 RepID=A0A975BNQ3_9BACT|nr:FG-GAP repeat-containing protein, cohesin domain-containing [Desulfonema magnum]
MEPDEAGTLTQNFADVSGTINPSDAGMVKITGYVFSDNGEPAIVASGVQNALFLNLNFEVNGSAERNSNLALSDFQDGLSGATTTDAIFTLDDPPDGEIKITASDGEAKNGFGYSVSIDGDYLIVGSTINDTEQDHNPGSAYIFKQDGSTWVQQAKVTSSDSAEDDAFGCSVSISGDYAIASDPNNDDMGKNSGSAYIFKRNGTSWVQTAKLTASDGDAGDHFGHSVSISGNYAIVGAHLNDDIVNGSGSAYIYKKPSTGWSDMTETAKLTASDGEERAYLGKSVSISGDYAIVGTHFYGDKGSYSGSAYIFEKSSGGWSDMTETVKLTSDDGVRGDYFGSSVSVSGNYAIVGAYGNSDSGTAYIFQREGGTWIQQDKLIPDDGVKDDRFGRGVSISGDYAIAGAYYKDNQKGSAYIFRREDNGWIQTKLTATDGMAEDRFGCSVSISDEYAIVGAYLDDDKGTDSGSIYIYKIDSPPPPESVTLFVGDAGGAPGDNNIPVSISLDNNEPVASMEFRLRYDAGTGIHANGSSTLTSRTQGFDATVTVTENGADSEALVLLFRIGGSIASGTGEVLKLLFDIDSDASGTSALSFTECVVFDTSEVPAKLDSDCTDTGKITASACSLEGDINCDGKVNIQDIQLCINCITGKGSCEGCDILADGNHDIGDIQRIINIILGSSGKRRSARDSDKTNTLTLPDIQLQPNETAAFGLGLTSETTIASGQIRFVYDAATGLTITGVNLTSRTEGFSEPSFERNDTDPSNTEILVLFYDADGEAAISPDSGDILEFTYETDSDASGTVSLAFTEAILANSEADSLRTVGQPPGLGNVDRDKDVDLSDAILALKALAGMIGDTLYTSADVNDDQKIGLEEAVYIFQVVAGMRN